MCRLPVDFHPPGFKCYLAGGREGVFHIQGEVEGQVVGAFGPDTVKSQRWGRERQKRRRRFLGNRRGKRGAPAGRKKEDDREKRQAQSNIKKPFHTFLPPSTIGIFFAII